MMKVNVRDILEQLLYLYVFIIVQTVVSDDGDKCAWCCIRTSVLSSHSGNDPRGISGNSGKTNFAQSF